MFADIHPDFRVTDMVTAPMRQLQRDLDEVAQAHSRASHVLTDWCVRHLLTFWQSELEPEVIYGPGWELKGLGHAGQVIIPLRWLAFVDFGHR